MRAQRLRRAGLQSRGGMDRDGKDHLVRIPVVHEWPIRDPVGRGKLHGIRGNSLRQLPDNLWRFARVPGIAPIDMPALVHHHVEAHLGAPTGLNGVGDWNQLYHDVKSMNGTMPGGGSSRS